MHVINNEKGVNLDYSVHINFTEMRVLAFKLYDTRKPVHVLCLCLLSVNVHNLSILINNSNYCDL